MHRIDTKTAQKDKFGAGKNGFTRGNPQNGTPATDLDDDYFDMLQEELCSVVEASGASLEKGRHDQLLTALRALLLSRKNPFGDIKSDGTVKTALENLGLDTALAGKQAKDDTLTALSGKNVAQLLTYLTLGPIANAADIAAGSANKLIDAYGLNSYFPSRRFGTSGYIRIPNQPGGLILQWGTIPAIPAGGYVTVSYGFAFPEAYLVVIPIAGSSSGAANSVLSAGAGDPRLSFQVFNSLPGVTDSTGTGAYIALGF